MINEPILDWEKWKGVCVICHRNINVNKEKYVKLIDMEGKKELSYVIYHLDCWQNRFSVTQENIQKMANQWLGKIADLSNDNKVIDLQ